MDNCQDFKMGGASIGNDSNVVLDAVLAPEPAAALFPEGCPVLCCRTSAEGASVADQNVSVGIVESVDVATGSRRESTYVIKLLGSEGRKVAMEGSLRFAPRCPVLVRDFTRLEGTWLNGTIMSSYDVPSFGGDVGEHDGTDLACFYSAWVVLPDGNTTAIHGVPTANIKFRPVDDKASTSNLGFSGQQEQKTSVMGEHEQVAVNSADHKESDGGKSDHQTRVQSDEAETNVVVTGSSEDGASDSSDDKKHSGGGDGGAENGEHTTTDHTGAKRSSVEYRLDVPKWLSKMEVTGYLVGKGGERKHELERRMKCQIKITGKGSGTRKQDGSSKENLQVIIKAPSGKYSQNIIGRARREIEDLLIGYVGKDRSRGRLMYELAVKARKASVEMTGGSYKDSPNAAVFQRAHYDLNQKVWMDVLELPHDRKGKVHGRFLVGPHGEILRRVGEDCDCRIAVHGAFDEEMLCDPYVIITAAEIPSVAKARRTIKSMIREHQEKCPTQCSFRHLYEQSPSHPPQDSKTDD